MRFFTRILFVSFVLWGLVGQAQVVKSINDENLNIPMPAKPSSASSQARPSATITSSVTIDTATVYFRLIDSAQTHIQKKDWSNATIFIRKAIVAEPSNPNNSLLLSNLATLQRYQGKLSDAIKNYTLAIDMTPNAVALLNNRAALYLQVDSLRLAIADYKRVVALDPADEEARYNLGMIGVEQRDFKLAEQYFIDITRYHPNSSLAIKGQAFLNKEQGNYAKAAQCFSKVIEVEPTPSLLANRADCYLMMKKLAEAADDINNAIAINPDDGYLYLLRAKLKKLRYENEEVKKDVQLAVKHGIDPAVAKGMLE